MTDKFTTSHLARLMIKRYGMNLPVRTVEQHIRRVLTVLEDCLCVLPNGGRMVFRGHFAIEMKRYDKRNRSGRSTSHVAIKLVPSRKKLLARMKEAHD